MRLWQHDFSTERFYKNISKDIALYNLSILFGFMLNQHSIDHIAFSSFTGGVRPHDIVPMPALFQAQTGTRVEPPTFCLSKHLVIKQ
jgi:hypothetical protein